MDDIDSAYIYVLNVLVGGCAFVVGFCSRQHQPVNQVFACLSSKKMWVIKKSEIISPRLAEEGCQLVCLFYCQLSQKRVACFFQDNIGLENLMLEHLLSKATHLTLYRKIGLCPVKPAHQKSALQHYQKKSADFQWAGLCSLAFQRKRIERPLKFKRQGRRQRWQLEWLAGRVGWVITQALADGEEIILINFLPQSS